MINNDKNANPEEGLLRTVSFGAGVNGRSYSTFDDQRNFIFEELPTPPDGNSLSRKAMSDTQVYHMVDAGHCHTDEDLNSPENSHARKTLIMASVLCLAFMIGELIGGALAGSLAIMTDAAHLLTDFAGFMISLFALYVAARPATRKMSFGWHRAEVLGATVSVLLIWVITGILVYIAIQRIVNKTYDINASIMLITAGVGVFVNICMGLLLHFRGHGHSHGLPSASGGHGHSHGSDGKPGVNINVRAALIHVIGDFFQSVGVFIAALIIFFAPHLAIIDPICTFLFSILVLITTVTIMRDAISVLMEAVPRGINMNKVVSELMEIDGVLMVHNLRMWSLTMDKVAFSAHFAIDKKADPKLVLKQSSEFLRARYSVYEITIQLEHFTRDMEDCTQCEIPTK